VTARLAAAFVLLALPAAAQPAPPAPEAAPRLIPTRDVDVTYVVPRGTQELTQRLRWTAALSRLRVDLPSPGLFTIVDYTTHRMTTVRANDRTAFDLPAPTAVLPTQGARPPADYRRIDTDRVAGQDCTDWETHDNAGQKTTVCITADGVLLRAKGEGGVMLSARTVSYATQDPALFQVPDGYARRRPKAESSP
jgi:hypothetical protein